MPLYDQTNPNFAFVTVPSATWLAEPNPGPPSNELTCGSTIIPNPYYTSWLPLGPISGDPGALGASAGCGWWYTAICGPTAGSMALMAAINGKSRTTSYAGWTQAFYNAVPPADQVGYVPNPTIALTSTDSSTDTLPGGQVVSVPRPIMASSDIERVILMAIKQATNPNGGGGLDAILSTATDFSPAATGSYGDANTISNATFASLIQNGNVIVFAIHEFTAHVARLGRAEHVTFTFNGGGHILTVNAEQSGVLTIYDPVYGAREMLTMEGISAGLSSRGSVTRTMAPPNSLTTAAVWPDASHPILTPWDVFDGQIVTFIDGFVEFSVP